MSLAEQVTWSVLRDRRFRGLRFHRRHLIGPFVVAFYCPDLRLALELDERPGAAAAGRVAQEWRALLDHCEASGVRCIRLPARSIELDARGTIDGAVRAALDAPPRPGPPGVSVPPRSP